MTIEPFVKHLQWHKGTYLYLSVLYFRIHRELHITYRQTVVIPQSWWDVEVLRDGCRLAVFCDIFSTLPGGVHGSRGTGEVELYRYLHYLSRLSFILSGNKVKHLGQYIFFTILFFFDVPTYLNDFKCYKHDRHEIVINHSLKDEFPFA